MDFYAPPKFPTYPRPKSLTKPQSCGPSRSSKSYSAPFPVTPYYNKIFVYVTYFSLVRAVSKFAFDPRFLDKWLLGPNQWNSYTLGQHSEIANPFWFAFRIFNFHSVAERMMTNRLHTQELYVNDLEHYSYGLKTIIPFSSDVGINADLSGPIYGKWAMRFPQL